MIEEIAPIILQYGVLGVWTFTLLFERREQKKIQQEERQEHIEVIKENTKAIALVNDNLKDLKNSVANCHLSRG